MKINYNRTGNERKALVAEIAELTGEKPVYMRTPTYAFRIGPFEVSRYGVLSWEDRADDTAKEIIAQLAESGFEGEAEDTEETSAPENTEKEDIVSEELSETKPNESSSEEEAPAGAEKEPEDEAESGADDEEAAGLTIEMPLDKVAVGTLTNVLSAKGSLIKKALGVDDLRIEVKDDKVAFPWFQKLPSPEETQAYTMFISLLCKFSKELKRASSTETPVTNEKYAFHCFLLRLGFIGAEYKAERKILLQNLSGNSSWKNGAPEKSTAPSEAADETAEAALESGVAANA